MWENEGCRTCALYERQALWYKDGCFGTWAVCSSNFSDRDQCFCLSQLRFPFSPLPPVTQLDHGQCRMCALYERQALWYKDGCFGTWAVCSSNFSDRDQCFCLSQLRFPFSPLPVSHPPPSLPPPSPHPPLSHCPPIAPLPTLSPSFQPVTQLDHGQCRTCALYERQALWYKDGCFGTWAVCSSNFSDRDSRGLFTFLQPGSFHANLACYACNHTGVAHAAPEAPTSADTGADVSVFLWMSVVVAGMGIVIIIAACSVFLAAEPEAEAERVRLEGERAKFIEMGGGKSDGRPRFHDGYHYEGSEDEDKGEHKRHGQQHRAEFSGRFRDEAGDVLSDIDEEDEEETTGLFPMHHTHSSAVPGAPRRAQPQLPVSSVPAPVPAAAAAGTGIAAAGLTTTPTGAGGVRESPNLVEVSILQSPPGRPFEATPNPTTAAAYYHEW
ncbi:unnamed protein product [Closterium sp. Naga37s-1]|nr:unnamed protein product [Closterium sp. Naga37s-1]